MARIVEILVGVSALAGIASFLGFRALFRKSVRDLKKLGRTPPAEPKKELERRPGD